jgi:hypothetical protein
MQTHTKRGSFAAAPWSFRETRNQKRETPYDSYPVRPRNRSLGEAFPVSPGLKPREMARSFRTGQHLATHLIAACFSWLI